MISMTFKTKQVNYKALLAYEIVTDRSTRCYFIDLFTRRKFNHIISVTPVQIEEWVKGKHIQKAMPNLSKDVRELFLTGLTDNEFEKLFESA